MKTQTIRPPRHYRLLRRGEVICAGDKYLHSTAHPWEHVVQSIGKKVGQIKSHVAFATRTAVKKRKPAPTAEQILRWLEVHRQVFYWSAMAQLWVFKGQGLEGTIRQAVAKAMKTI